MLRPKKKYVFTMFTVFRPGPYFFTSTLKLFIRKFITSWKMCLPLKPKGIISSITVESVFKTVNELKNMTNDNS
jgi:hypothetical protein